MANETTISPTTETKGDNVLPCYICYPDFILVIFPVIIP